MFDAPVVPLVVILVLAAAAGVVAAMRPARRAARLDMLQAIAADVNGGSRNVSRAMFNPLQPVAPPAARCSATPGTT